MGCGPQVVKRENLQSASALQKKVKSERSSYINFKGNPSNQIIQETWYESERKPSKNFSRTASYQSVSFLKLESAMAQKGKKLKELLK